MTCVINTGEIICGNCTIYFLLGYVHSIQFLCVCFFSLCRTNQSVPSGVEKQRMLLETQVICGKSVEFLFFVLSWHNHNGNFYFVKLNTNKC